MTDSVGIIDPKSFVFNPERRRYEAHLQMDEVRLLITVAAENRMEDRMGTAFPEPLLRRSVEWLFNSLEAVLEYCAQELLAVKNEGWLKDGETPSDATRFKQKLRLKQTDIHSDGSLTLVFLDGGLFWGHWVVVEVGPDLKFRLVTLQG